MIKSQLLNKWLIIILVLICQSAVATVVTYKPSENISESNPYIMPSAQYKIEIQQDGKVYSTFVYQMNAMHVTNNSKTTSWINFSFSGVVTVRITNLTQHQNDAVVLPSSKNIKATTNQAITEFTINQAGHYTVDYQKGIYIDHPLLIFANPLENEMPSPKDTNIVYFGPGFHDIGIGYEIKSNKTVYLHGDAYVKGQFVSKDSKNITIKGRGILSGETHPAGSANHMISFTDSKNITIEGITIIHAPRYKITLRGSHHTIKNVKMMGWWFSTDGISAGDNTLIENCFFKVNDDAVKLYSQNTTVKNCVIWQLENGAPFMISWNMPRDYSNCNISNIDVVRVEHEWDNENLAVVCAIHGASAHISKMTFENINVENSNWRMFHLVTRPNRWASWHQSKGSISDLEFKNITQTDNPAIKSLIIGHDTHHPVYNIEFKNLSIGGEKVTEENYKQWFLIDSETTRNIKFKP